MIYQVVEILKWYSTRLLPKDLFRWENTFKVT